MTKPVQRRRLTHVSDGTATPRHDSLATEEPLEIRVNGSPFAVTMRTPGDDFDLVAGFCVSEGIAAAPTDLQAMRYCAGEQENTYNIIDVTVPAAGAVVAAVRERHVYTSSSCGVCGLASIDAVATTSRFDVSDDDPRIPADVIAVLPDRLRAEQRIFDSTGGVHAAGLFTSEGDAVCVREDVGRHNAVDKVVGWAWRENRLPLTGTILQVSGRASFELVQKAAMAGIPTLAAVSAPSSLAADLAERSRITLVGFSRGTTFNIYAHPDRITAMEGP